MLPYPPSRPSMLSQRSVRFGADIFTNPLDEGRFYELLSEFNVLDSRNLD
jgi:hypothetical protein